MGVAAATRVGPGHLYFAPLGTAEPATPTATPDAAWRDLGYTEQGSTWGIDVTTQNITVEEEFEPLKIIVTARVSHMEFNLAEITQTNLQMALNSGTAPATSGAYTTFEPPTVGDEVRGMLMWRSATSPIDEQIIFRQVLQVGAITAARRKANLTVFALRFNAEIPASGLKPWERWALTSSLA